MKNTPVLVLRFHIELPPFSLPPKRFQAYRTQTLPRHPNRRFKPKPTSDAKMTNHEATKGPASGNNATTHDATSNQVRPQTTAAGQAAPGNAMLTQAVPQTTAAGQAASNNVHPAALDPSSSAPANALVPNAAGSSAGTFAPAAAPPPRTSSGRQWTASEDAVLVRVLGHLQTVTSADYDRAAAELDGRSIRAISAHWFVLKQRL